MPLSRRLIPFSLVLAVCAVTACVSSLAESDPRSLTATERSRQERTEPLQSPWAFVAISSHGDRTAGGIRPEVIRQGPVWIESEVERLYRQGFRVVLIHRPFGEPDGEDLMDYDALLQLREDPVAGPVVQNMGAAFERMLVRHPDLHLVAYVGSMNADTLAPVFDENPDRWLARAALAIWPLLESKSPRLHLAIDHSSNFELDSPEHLWIQLADRILQQRGASLWIEAFPRTDHMASFPAFGTQRAWELGVLSDRAQPSRIANARFFFDLGLPAPEWVQDVETTDSIPVIRHNLKNDAGNTPARFLAELGIAPPPDAFD